MNRSKIYLCLSVLLLQAPLLVAAAYKDELPYLRGEQYVTQVTMDTLEEHTKNLPVSSPALLFVGAKWCPHCRNFKPTFNILADYLQHNKTEGANPKCLYYEAVEDKDPISKKFKLGGYPAILLFERNRFFKYEGPKELEPILKWIDEKPQILAENYPDSIPGFLDDFSDAVHEMWKTLKASYKKDPTSQFYLLGAIAIVLGAFGIMFVYAIISALFSSPENKEKPE